MYGDNGETSFATFIAEAADLNSGYSAFEKTAVVKGFNVNPLNISSEEDSCWN